MRSPIELAIVPLGRALRKRRAGDGNSIRHRPELVTPESLQVSSQSFAAGGTIPPKYSKVAGGENISPELTWSPVPDETKQMLIVMEDIDVPFAEPGIHMSALFDPSITSFAEGALVESNRHVRFIPSSRGRLGYSGPRPFPGHGPHSYAFYVFALGTTITPDEELSSVYDVLPLVGGKVLASGGVTGFQEG